MQKAQAQKQPPNRPYAVKEVLEDGLLGDVQHSNTYGRKEAPEVTAQSAKQDEEVVLKFANEDHFDKVEKIFINGNFQELSAEKYSKNEKISRLPLLQIASRLAKIPLVLMQQAM